MYIYIHTYTYIAYTHIHIYTHVLSDRDSIVANGEKEEKSERIEEREANNLYREE